jgi:hypothetical protein
MGERRGAYRVLVGKFEGKTLLGAPSHRWESDIKLDFKEIGRGCGLHSSWSLCGQLGRNRVWVIF